MAVKYATVKHTLTQNIYIFDIMVVPRSTPPLYSISLFGFPWGHSGMMVPILKSAIFIVTGYKHIRQGVNSSLIFYPAGGYPFCIVQIVRSD